MGPKSFCREEMDLAQNFSVTKLGLKLCHLAFSQTSERPLLPLNTNMFETTPPTHTHFAHSYAYVVLQHDGPFEPSVWHFYLLCPWFSPRCFNSSASLQPFPKQLLCLGIHGVDLRTRTFYSLKLNCEVEIPFPSTRIGAIFMGSKRFWDHNNNQIIILC